MDEHSEAQEPGAAAGSRPLVRARGVQVSVGDIDLTAVHSELVDLGIDGAPCFESGGADALDAHDLLDLLEHLRLMRATIAAVEARAISALATTVRRDCTRREQREGTADGITAREVSLTTGRSPSVASGRVRSSQRLVQDMPRTLTAVSEGLIDSDKAHAAARITASLSSQQRAQVDQAIASRLPDLVGAGARQWRREVEAIGELVDPGGQERRHQHARLGRTVTVRPREHGMATLSLTVPALEATLARKRLSLEGERLRAAGDRRGHATIMADTACEALIGRNGPLEPVTLDVGVIITDRALLCSHSSEPAVIEGYGAVPIGQVRGALREALREPSDESDLATDGHGPALRAALRRLYTHPRSGELVAVESRARAFPPGLSRFLRWRSLTCAGPFCDAPIRHDDHIQPYSSGGATSLNNGNGLCAHCNDKERMHLTAARVDSPARPGRHRVRWTSRYGSTAEAVPTPSELAALLPQKPHDASDTDPTAARPAAVPPIRPPQRHRRRSVTFCVLPVHLRVAPDARARPKHRLSDMKRIRWRRQDTQSGSDPPVE